MKPAVAEAKTNRMWQIDTRGLHTGDVVNLCVWVDEIRHVCNVHSNAEISRRQTHAGKRVVQVTRGRRVDRESQRSAQVHTPAYFLSRKAS